MESPLDVLAAGDAGTGPRTLAEKAFETLHGAIVTACAAHDPDKAALALHDHLARTANSVSVAMGGEPLFELSLPAAR
jgi:DNA-binding FadR family transcriptional regulator